MAVIRGKLASINDTADIFGVSSSTVDKWLRQGCPYVEKGNKSKAWVINSAEVSKWLRAREVEALGVDTTTADELRKRKLAAETGKAELELAKSRGDVIPLRRVERALSNTFAEFRIRLLNIPGRVATQIIGESEEDKIKAAVRDELLLALNVLDEFSLAEKDDDQSTES